MSFPELSDVTEVLGDILGKLHGIVLVEGPFADAEDELRAVAADGRLFEVKVTEVQPRS